jgi:hypothetical protein
MLETEIMDFLTRHKGRLYCDECLTRELKRHQRARISAATHEISVATGFQRATETCAGCGGVQDGTKAR